MHDFASALRRRIANKGYTHTKLANDAYLSERTVRRLLNDDNNDPQVETLLAIAKVLYNNPVDIRVFMGRLHQYPLSHKYYRVEDLIAGYSSTTLDEWNDLLDQWGENYSIPRRYRSIIK